MKNPIRETNQLGQSLWYDNIQRRLLLNGEMATLISNGDIRGMTSNPSIFHNAIAKSKDYDSALIPMAWSGWGSEKIFWQLAIEDIQTAIELFTPLYQQTGGEDGFVSLEVNPFFAHDTEATIEQAKHLWQEVNRPNLMVKIPATPEGLPAIRQAIAAGINVNVTLIFSIERYQEVMKAYMDGLTDRLKAGLSVSHIASVASFFVSRLDSKIDDRLPADSPLRGKAAIANTKIAYEEFGKIFHGEDFKKLQAKGCQIQRPLWASTSTKNPAYPDTLYMDNLIGSQTVNTVPPATLDAFRKHGKVDSTLTHGVDKAKQVITDLEKAGIFMKDVTQELENEGVKAFMDAFTALLATIDDRRNQACGQLGSLQIPVAHQVSVMTEEMVVRRLHDADPFLWVKDLKEMDETSKRLGWLNLPDVPRNLLDEIRDFVLKVKEDGFTHSVLLGMGGSSLCPEVLSLIFPQQGIRFSILDSTDPAQVLRTGQDFPPGQTLYILSSKSGSTAEVLAFFDHFWEQCGHLGSNFIAITDPGTSLEKLANEHGFRKIFIANPNVGGRYSALTHFGLVPAALMGIDLDKMLKEAKRMAEECSPQVPEARNPGLALGAVLGCAALNGKDKLTFIADKEIAALGAWMEQLIAESSGKLGKGILPVDGEELLESTKYGKDRLFVYLRQSGDHDEWVGNLQSSGSPVIRMDIQNGYKLGAEFFRWEFATAIACHIIGVNAFDQPDVQDSKDRTNRKIIEYKNSKTIDDEKPFLENNILKLYSSNQIQGSNFAGIVDSFLSEARSGDYVAINAYVPRNDEMQAKLHILRTKILKRTGCATTLGFGPRFLHSTGQFHKGGPGTGIYLQITNEPQQDIPIPGQGMTFGVLERAQALGDYEALVSRDRRILRIHLKNNIIDILQEMIESL
jgi:transaldolase/glucose-6-phosphate isomerase